MASAEPGNMAFRVPGRTAFNKPVRPLSVQEKATAFACRVLRRLAGFRAYWLLQMGPDDVPESYLGDKPELTARMISGNDLAALTGQHNDLGKHFIARSIRSGDWCHAYFDGNRLASYGWCSTTATRTADDFIFDFPRDFFYMHRGFTLPEYRGKRLNGHGMVAALNQGRRRGLRGLVGLVEVQNVPSLRSSVRLGQRRIGKIFVFRLFGRWITLRTPGCRRLGCTLARR